MARQSSFARRGPNPATLTSAVGGSRGRSAGWKNTPTPNLPPLVLVRTYTAYNAGLVTAFGANANLAFTAVAGGPAANSIRIRYLDPGNVSSAALSVAVSGNDITVNLATSAGTNEVQTVTITGGPTGGNFTLTFNGQTTGNLAFNADAATVQTALRALSSIGGANVNVTGGAGGPYTVTFTGTLARTNVAQMTAAHTFTGGATPNIGVTTTTPGVAVVLTSTASQVRDAVNASAPASALVSAALAPGNNGSGVVPAMAYTPLAGGDA